MAHAQAEWRDDWARVLDSRWALLVVVSAASAVMAGGRGDWNLFVEAARDMMSRDIGLGVYVAHSDVQTGPLTLLLTWVLSATPRNGFVAGVVVSAGLGLWSLWAVERVAASRWADDRLRELATLVGGAVVVVSWAQLGGYGHLDDAIVLALAVRCMLGHHRSWVRGLLIGLAIGVKPWAVVLVPLVVDWSLLKVAFADASARAVSIWRTLVPLVVAGCVAVVCWAPFVVHSPDTTKALRPSVSLADDSVLALFGVTRADLPAAVRLLQLAGALAAATWCCWRGRPLAALMAAMAVRIATDLGTWSYYTPALLIGTLLWDLLERRRVVPLLTIVTAILMTPSWIVDDPDTRAAMRLAACLLVVFTSCWVRSPLRARTD